MSVALDTLPPEPPRWQVEAEAIWLAAYNEATGRGRDPMAALERADDAVTAAKARGDFLR